MVSLCIASAPTVSSDLRGLSLRTDGSNRTGITRSALDVIGRCGTALVNTPVRIVCALRDHDDMFEFTTDGRRVACRCRRCLRVTEGWGR